MPVTCAGEINLSQRLHSTGWHVLYRKPAEAVADRDGLVFKLNQGICNRILTGPAEPRRCDRGQLPAGVIIELNNPPLSIGDVIYR
jgi:hypothetical protein